MAKLDPPPNFEFNKPDEWSRWKRRFEQYRSASGLTAKDEACQISTLLYCMGEDAEDVLTATAISNADRAKYSEVIKKFDDFYKVRTNVIYERARFNRRNQQPGETIDQYITVLHRLADTCNYPADLKSEMIRDRLVVGILDTAVSQKLQLDSALDLAKAMKYCRQGEAVKEQQSDLRGASKSNPIVVDELRRDQRRTARKPYQQGRGSSKPGGAKQGANERLCKRCGGKNHPKGGNCPAKEAICHRCNHKGHYSAQCFSKTVAETLVENEEFSLDASSVTIGTVSGKEQTSWTVDLLVQEHSQVKFKIDTGAEVTVISEKDYQSLHQGAKLEKPKLKLYGPTRQALNTIGRTKLKITKQSTSVSTTQYVYVVRDLKVNLLGLPAVTALNLVARVDSTISNETSSLDPKARYPSLFTGLGTMGEEYHIRLKKDAKPQALFAPRNVPIPLRDKVEEGLRRMEQLGVIEPVHDPTPWCAGMVVVPKSSGAVRICVDLKPLNESVLRETHPMPSVDDTLAQLSGATVFSKVDANSGFWQIPLAADSCHLTTFITPMGRFCFKKLPFGISSAPELFQKRMSQILTGLKGVICHIDDVLIFGSNQAEHDDRLCAVLDRLSETGVTLNGDKCVFGQSQIKFLGHLIDKDGIRSDPDKVAAITKLDPPSNITQLRRLTGMINQLGKFSPNLSELSKPLRELLSPKKAWTWGPDQTRAFEEIKKELTRPTVLALYNPRAPTKVSADASSFGLGAVLLQQSDQEWRPVAYASRSMTDTETRYAQIEKEALATTWSCEKFSNYLLGQRFQIETDHKPLVPLLSTKRLDSLPPRIVRFRLRLGRFDYSISHTPGKLLYTADTLSRAPLTTSDHGSDLPEEVDVFVNSVISSLPASPQCIERYRKSQEEDPVCVKVKQYCQTEWPEKRATPAGIRPYWKARSSLSVCNQLLMFNHRIVVPSSLQKEALERIHESHQGISRCRMRSKSSVWWPGISSAIEDMIQRCPVCVRDAELHHEPLMSTALPQYPWQMLGSDLFELKGTSYLLVVDYFSRYPEVIRLTSTTSAAVITALKSMFSRHGIPECFRSDNGPQYSSSEFGDFAKKYGFEHNPSSPRFPQSNGLADRTVKTVKQLLAHSADLSMALLNYRATPLPWCDRSPAELLMGRRIRSTLPQVRQQLIPGWNYMEEVQQADKCHKLCQKKNYDHRHKARELPPITCDTEVWVKSGDTPVRGTIQDKLDTPRSYLVNTPTGTHRRNRYHLAPVPPEQSSEPPPIVVESSQPSTEPRKIMTRSQTGTQTRLPIRFRED